MNNFAVFRRAVMAALSVAAVGACLPMSTAIAQDDATAADEAIEEIITTGSIIRRAQTATASPVTVLTEDQLDLRGINTIADAVTMLPANNAGTMNASWSTFGFATGASAVSLRGLTTSASLTVFDGMRMAPYPLGDDGQRNFVDLGTIPDSIVERIEILKDGASATYGADAIAGVVNVITKKEITGLHFGTSYGFSQESLGDEYRGDVTWGTGELDSDGFNFYMALEAQHNDPIAMSDGPAPFNTWDWSDVCNSDGVCMDNNARNGLQYDGTIYGVSGNGTAVPMVRPWDAVDGAMGNWELLNTQAGCRHLEEVNPSNAADVDLTGPVCTEDRSTYVNLYPRIDRSGLNLRYTGRFGDAEAYAMLNYYKVNTDQSGGTPWGFHGTTTPGGPEIVRVGITPVLLPVYVCPLGPDGIADICDATNGTLNPNNPYAAQGQTARLSYTPGNYVGGRAAAIETESLRYAFGIEGSFGDWDYTLDAVFARIDLEQTRTGYPKPRRLLNAIADGSLNLVDPSQNSQAVWDYMYPSVTNTNTSDVDHYQATLVRSLFEASGGDVVAAFGIAYREESVHAPSANGFQNDPYERYLSVNTVAATGERDVSSAFFEVDAPLTDMLTVNLQGRYDDYSSGQSDFSPKFGIQFQPTDMIKLRGTYSEGFRIPSFNEAFGEPTTGYITQTIDPGTPEGAAFLAAHGNNAYATGQFNVGLTASGNSELEPEQSEAFTAGVVFELERDVAITLDWWRIEVNDLVSNADYSPALEQYYQNNGVVNVPGLTVIPADIDPDYPNALPHLGFIGYSYQNADSEIAEGIDLGLNWSHDFGSWYFNTNLETSYLMELSKTIEGEKLNFEGTLSPCDVTSCSGAPDWRATWVSSISREDLTLALTANYTGSYSNTSADYGGDPSDCEGSVGNSVYFYADGSGFKCDHGSYTDFDFSAQYQVSENVGLFLNIINVFDTEPEFDPASAYWLYGFNPAWELNGWRGRYFRLGVKADFE